MLPLLMEDRLFEEPAYSYVPSYQVSNRLSILFLHGNKQQPQDEPLMI
jgi:hypothetical protein